MVLNIIIIRGTNFIKINIQLDPNSLINNFKIINYSNYHCYLSYINCLINLILVLCYNYITIIIATGFNHQNRYYYLYLYIIKADYY